MPRGDSTPEVVTEPCAACLGSGVNCDTCDGRGWVRRRVRAAAPKAGRSDSRRRARSRPLAYGEPCSCGRARAPDLRERIPGGDIIHHGRNACPRRPPSAVLVYLSEEQHAALSAAAARAGLGLGPWLRAIGMEAASCD